MNRLTSRFLVTAGICFFLIIFGIKTPVFAACGAPSYCDAPPGQCSSTATTNGVSGPIVINNGGWNYTGQSCTYSCFCDIPFGCGGTFTCGTNNQVYCNGVGGMVCRETCVTNGEPVQTCSEVIREACCNPGCDASRYNCSGSGPAATPAPTPVVLAPTAPPAPQGGGGNTDTGGNNNPTGPVCGNGSCEGGETCSSCSSDCGACPVVGPYCGDGSCTGFESCSSCSSDCGACQVLSSSLAWWQSKAGSVYAGVSSGTALLSTIIDSFCVAPTCSAQLVAPDSTSQAYSEGLALTGGGTLSGFNKVNTSNSASIGTAASRYFETYSFFYRKTNLGANPVDDFAGSATDAQKPATGKEAYFHDGDLTIQDQWDITSGQSFVVFVDGNLTLSDTSNVGELIKVAEGGFLAFIVSGNITIANDVGNTTLTNTTGNVEGVYIADGTITVASKGAAAGGDERFIGEGTFVGWSGVELDRDYSDGGARAAENNTKPVEQFVYRPDLVKNAPEVMKHPHSIWQESK